MSALDTTRPEVKVKDMYRQVAENPPGTFHFEMGQGVAERLGHPTTICAGSLGVINLSPGKEQVFAELARVLRPGGGMAIADIVSEAQFTDAIVCADLWAACIGGAAQEGVSPGWPSHNTSDHTIHRP